MGKKNITLKDIALHTGLTANTVSKVLNNKPYFSKEVEEKVLKATRELGYICNSNAAALRRGTSRTIAIIFDDLSNPFYFVMTDIIAANCNAGGYDTIIFSNYGASSYLEYDLLKKVLSRNPDGIISFIEPSESVTGVMKNLEIPFLVSGRDCTERGYDCIYVDDEGGGYLATKHLIEKGHRDILYLGSDETMVIDRRRRGGYLRALSEAGIAADERNIITFKQFEVKMDRVADYLLSTGCTAVFSFNDSFAYTLIRILNSRGKQVPEDIAVAGFDNIQKYMKLPRYLTTVDVDCAQMADVASEVLLAKMRDETLMKRDFTKMHQAQLIIGSST